MKKWSRIDSLCISIFILFYICLILALTKGQYFYGSKIDWENQYWAFAEYFRNLFYKTHQLFPNFAMNLGGGQNIYNFSYYGLFNPIILFSYLLPMVDMIHYIEVANIVVVIASTILFYIWVKRNGFDRHLCFLTTFLFLCAGPLIFHSHKQIVFIDYMPFLMMAFIGVDIYFEKKKSMIFVLGVFFMILTSYYFSIGGIFALAIYCSFKFIKETNEFHLKDFLLFASQMLLRVITSIAMSAILLIPTFYALVNGRKNQSTSHLFDLSMFIPAFYTGKIAFDAYSVGLSAIVLIALISGFFLKKAHNIFLSFVLSLIILFPFFDYLLNGTLYFNTKVFIPLLPLYCLCIIEYLYHLWESRFNVITYLLTGAIMALLIYKENYSIYNEMFLVDAIITMALIFIARQFQAKWILTMFLIIFSGYKCYLINGQDHLLPKAETAAVFSENNNSAVNTILKKDHSFYRFLNGLNQELVLNKIYGMNYYETGVYSSSSNQEYEDAYYGNYGNDRSFRNYLILSPSQNILFDLYMGNKYLISQNDPPVGYTPVLSKGITTVYKNDDVFPLGYETNKLMSNKQFQSLSVPDKSEALLKYGIVKKAENVDFKSDFIPYNLIDSVGSINTNHVAIQGLGNNSCKITASDNSSIHIKLDNNVNKNILVLKFHMDYHSPYYDQSITINGKTNTLSSSNSTYQNNNSEFTYVLSSQKPLQSLDITFTNGVFQLGDIQAYGMDYNQIQGLSHQVSPFVVNMKKTIGDHIVGTIKAASKGEFILNVPYDKYFHVFVDHKKVVYQKVNSAFIGFKMKKGIHKIFISYTAPFQEQSMVLSIIGVGGFMGIILYECKFKKKLKKVWVKRI